MAAQVGYCQGMAFVTGIVLMYLPEEPAFKVRSFTLNCQIQPGVNACLECGSSLDAAFILSSASCTVPFEHCKHHAAPETDFSTCCAEPCVTQVLVRLLGPGGPDLRRSYLPGLEGLKEQLRMFEWLMARVLGRLCDHLEARTQLLAGWMWWGSGDVRCCRLQGLGHTVPVKHRAVGTEQAS